MTELGPVDLVALSFPGIRPPDSFLRELEVAEQRRDIRVMDALVVVKDEAGELERLELTDIEDLRDAAADIVARRTVGLVGVEDVRDIGALMDPGTTVLVLLVENVWARETAAEARRHNGTLLANVRIGHQDIVRAEGELIGRAAGQALGRPGDERP